MLVTDRALLELARAALPEPLFRVWFAKHFQEKGRRSGSVALGISEEAWRYRLAVATRIVDRVVAARDAAA